MELEPENQEIPEELRKILEELREEKQRKINSLALEVVALRKEAVDGRKQSGIEEVWREDREYYEGIDEFNTSHTLYHKPETMQGGVERETDSDSTQCTAFFNLTRQFCDAGAARMGDILLPAGDWNFSIKASPVPEGEDEKDPEKTAELAETRIRDWLVEGSDHSVSRSVLENSAIVGTGIKKGPVPAKKTARKVEDGNVVVISGIKPTSFCTKPEDFYPDPACGENIQNGDYCFEKDTLSKKQLIELKKDPEYLSDQIDKVLKEGPGKSKIDNPSDDTIDKEPFEVWYFYGMLDVSKLDAMGVQLDGDGKDLVPAVVTLVNDTPIKAFLSPIDSEDFPFDVMPWQRVSGKWYGIGIARQGRTAQDMFNVSARELINNSGLGAKPMIILRDKAVRPADGQWIVRGGKLWIASEDADIRSVSDAFTIISIPMMQAELLGNMQEARKMMEDATGFYFIMQGQQGSAPDTVGGMELLHRNASTILRRLARTFDERITEPHIKRYYIWLLEHGEDKEKGDMQIEAIGSTALVEREIQAMQAMGILNLSVNPAFGLDPEKAIYETLKAQRFNPDKWTLDDKKKAELAQQQPPPDPRIEVANIKAQVDMHGIETTGQLKKLAIEQNTDRDHLYSQGVAQRTQIDAQLKIEELTLKRELSMLDYANRTQQTLDKVKADLAKTVMTLNLQEKLSGTNIATPAVEPKGRAREGHSFEE